MVVHNDACFGMEAACSGEAFNHFALLNVAQARLAEYARVKINE